MDQRILEKRIKRKENTRIKRQKRISLILLVLIVGIGTFTLIQTFVATPIKVAGNSMSPTLNHGQRVLFSKAKLNIGSLQRGDLVYFKLEDNRFYIKRIIGLPGEFLEIKDGRLYINGQAYQNELGPELLKTYDKDRWYLKDDEYFVLGDNWASDDSKDSRFFGPIKNKDIKGKNLFKIGY